MPARLSGLAALALACLTSVTACLPDREPEAPTGDPPLGWRALFGGDRPLDTLVTGEWWRLGPNPIVELDVPRDSTLAFALYTVTGDTLSLSAQLHPLYPGELREVTLELTSDAGYEGTFGAAVVDTGWAAQFRVVDSAAGFSSAGRVGESRLRYRLTHGTSAYAGVIRSAPAPGEETVIAALSCNSNRDRGDRGEYHRALAYHDPDLLFFAGDQSYDHTEHTAAWLKWGRQFGELCRDRPCVTIPDDHDVGQYNLWGAGGGRASNQTGADGGYAFSPAYVRMVERAQTAHLPEPYDPTPIEGGIGAYYTSFVWGGADLAIVEDRKWKSAPVGTVPQRGPRPDHITDPDYDPADIDLPGLTLLGERQLAFLRAWGAREPAGRQRIVLSQTGFCGGAHLHGAEAERLYADLDANGWPQAGRRRALEAIRAADAIHVAGDQHLATVLQHGIDTFGDGPWAFVVPAVVNDVYSRWWWPEGAAAADTVAEAQPWTGDYYDGFGNPITMHAYANPDGPSAGEGYGIVRIGPAPGREVTFECWPRYVDPAEGEQFAGWPITLSPDREELR